MDYSFGSLIKYLSNNICWKLIYNTADLITGEAGQIATGSFVGRQSEKQISLFKSVGNAVQDMYVARLIMRKAEELDIG